MLGNNARVPEAEPFLQSHISRVEMSGEAVAAQAIAGNLRWKDLRALRSLWRERQEMETVRNKERGGVGDGS